MQNRRKSKKFTVEKKEPSQVLGLKPRPLTSKTQDSTAVPQQPTSRVLLALAENMMWSGAQNQCREKMKSVLRSQSLYPPPPSLGPSMLVTLPNLCFVQKKKKKRWTVQTPWSHGSCTLHGRTEQRADNVRYWQVLDCFGIASTAFIKTHPSVSACAGRSLSSL